MYVVTNVEDCSQGSLHSGRKRHQVYVSSRTEPPHQEVRKASRALKVGQDFDRHTYEERVYLVKRMLRGLDLVHSVSNRAEGENLCFVKITGYLNIVQAEGGRS